MDTFVQIFNAVILSTINGFRFLGSDLELKTMCFWMHISIRQQEFFQSIEKILNIFYNPLTYFILNLIIIRVPSEQCKLTQAISGVLQRNDLVPIHLCPFFLI